jgi:hypothetical protein
LLGIDHRARRRLHGRAGGSAATSSAATSSAATGTGGSDASSSSGAAGGGGSPAPTNYVLSEYVGPKIWTNLERATAVNSSDRLFVTDGQTVFAVDDGAPSIYLTIDDLKAATSAGTEVEVGSLDVGPDDRLYVLDTAANHILVSDAPHNATLLYGDLQGKQTLGFPALIGVESPDRILMISHYDGLSAITPGGVSLVYGEKALLDVEGCASEDLAVSPKGRLWYLPGCNGSPLLGGLSDGSGVGIISTNKSLGETYWWGFNGIARDPHGGVVANVTGAVYRFEDGGPAVKLAITPTPAEIASAAGEISLFFNRPIEVGPSDAIYLIGPMTIYRALPQ